MPDVPDDLFAGFGRPPAPTGRGVDPPADLSARWDDDRESIEPNPLADLPELVPLGEGLAPAAAADLRDTGIDAAILADLALRVAYTIPSFNTEWAARR